MRQAMPIPSGTVDSCQLVRRQVFCQHYGDCLDYAIQKGWDGFSCEKCQGYERENLDRRHWEEDYARCVTLAYFCSLMDSKKSRAR